MVRCLDTWDGLVPTIFSIEPEDKKNARAKSPRFYTQTNPEFGLHFTQKRMIGSFREMFWIGFQVISWSKLFYRTRRVHVSLFFDLFLRTYSTLFSKSFSPLVMRYSFIDTLRVCVVSFVRKVVRHNEYHFTSIIFTVFEQLILESLQVFHNSNGIFGLLLSTVGIKGVLHISNCTFIIRERWNALMNWSIMTRNRATILDTMLKQSQIYARANTDVLLIFTFASLSLDRTIFRLGGYDELNVARVTKNQKQKCIYTIPHRSTVPYRSSVFPFKIGLHKCTERERRVVGKSGQINIRKETVETSRGSCIACRGIICAEATKIVQVREGKNSPASFSFTLATRYCSGCTSPSKFDIQRHAKVFEHLPQKIFMNILCALYEMHVIYRDYIGKVWNQPENAHRSYKILTANTYLIKN